MNAIIMGWIVLDPLSRAVDLGTRVYQLSVLFINCSELGIVHCHVIFSKCSESIIVAEFSLKGLRLEDVVL